jgi:hypothetical protein
MSQSVIKQEELIIDDRLRDNIEKFKEWLDKLDITHIVSYDDEWDKLSGRTYEEDINNYLTMDLEEFTEKFSVEISKEEFKLLDDEEVDTVKGILDIKETSKLSSLKEKVLRVFSVEKVVKPLEILKIMMEQIAAESNKEFKTYTKPNYEEISKIDGRILFLIDMNMKSVGLAEDSIIDVITLLKKHRSDNFDLAIAYSNDDLSSYKEHKSKVTYIEDYLAKHSDTVVGEFEKSQFKYLFAYQLWGINKTEKENELSEELLTTIEKAAFGYSLHDFLESKLLLEQTATKELVNLPEEKFDLLLQDAFIEGERFVDVLNRTHESILKRIEYNMVKKDVKYKDVMKNVMNVANAKDSLLIDKIKEQKLINFSKKELLEKIGKDSYIDIAEYNLVNYSINEMYENISTGDLFKIILHEDESPNYAVLITAGCDLPLRFPDKIQDKVKRKQENVVLCIYESKEIGEINPELKQIISNDQSIWPILLEDDKSYVLTPTHKILTINGKLLDLCSFNSTGEALLNKDVMNISLPYKNYHSIKYLEDTLIPWIDEVNNIKSYIGDSVEKAHIKESDLLSILAGLKYSVKMNHTDTKFEIKRIGRLDKELALNVIQYNISNLSRIGLDKIPLR